MLRRLKICDMTDLFSWTSSNFMSVLPETLFLLLASFLFFSNKINLFVLASGPVVKSASSRCKKNNPPESGQIVSDVVALVRVPNMGDNKDRRRGGKIKGRKGVDLGKRS